MDKYEEQSLINDIITNIADKAPVRFTEQLTWTKFDQDDKESWPPGGGFYLIQIKGNWSNPFMWEFYTGNGIWSISKGNFEVLCWSKPQGPREESK